MIYKAPKSQKESGRKYTRLRRFKQKKILFFRGAPRECLPGQRCGFRRACLKARTNWRKWTIWNERNYCMHFVRFPVYSKCDCDAMQLNWHFGSVLFCRTSL